MIKNKTDLTAYLAADEQALGSYRGGLLRRIFFSESLYLHAFLRALRKVEYLTNTKRNVWDNIRYAIAFYRYRKLGLKLHLSIPVNVLGPGAKIYHTGFIVLNPHARIGANCTLQPGVVVGQKDTPENVPTIGNNVYLGPGAQVIGRVRVGDNAVIAPNSVVIRDVPADCVVSGVPAKIIKANGVRQPVLWP